MNLEDAERALDCGPFPWPGVLVTYQGTRDGKLRQPDRDVVQVLAEYEDKVMEAFRNSGLSPLTEREAARIRPTSPPL